MNKQIVVYPVLFAALVLAGPVLAAAAPACVQDPLQCAVSGPQRSAAHKQRDAYRHPVKTLEFFGLRPDMRVIEVIPGSGWYTEILAPFLHDHGQLIEASFPRTSANAFYRKTADQYQQKLASDPAIYGQIELEPFEPPAYMALGAPGSADRVLTFRNMHDLVFANVHGQVSNLAIQRFFRNAYQVLKPGGVLGVVAHRADPGMPIAKSDDLGRLPQTYVVNAARQAGFTLAAASEVNANPKDSGTVSVWYLPPTLKQGQTKRAQYKAIGEADNMTLKFVKPKQPAG